MKTLIIYASKYGCTADCANYLQSRISKDVTLVDINKSAAQVDLDSYGTIIIGGSVYISKVSKKLRAFCNSNLDILTKKKTGIFLCSALSDEFNETLKNNFPESLLKSAKVIKLFGSEARLDKMSFADKMIIKAVTKGDFSKFKISNERMDEFVHEMS